MALIPLWSGFTYFPHQEEGIRWMLEKERVGTAVGSEKTVHGGFQCDDMGLGKTMQICATMVNHKKEKTLLISPLAMIETWSTVFLRAGFSVYEVEGGEWTRRSTTGHAIPRHFLKMRPSVYISNYEKLYIRPSLFSSSWDRVVLDEAHKIRNADGRAAACARNLQAPLRWAVTGTPLVNSIKDVVSLMAFLGVPCTSPWSWTTSLQNLFPSMVLHRSMDSLRKVIKGAPPIPEIIQDILPFATEEEEEFYHGVQGVTEASLLRYSSELLSSAASFQMLLRLRQLSVHPQVYINAKRREYKGYARPNWVGPSTKLARIGDILRGDAEGPCHKYILFCQFHEEMALIREYLLNESLVNDANILLYHGGLNQEERSKVLQTSKETVETTVLLLQLQAGGVGLNLQEYDRIIFVSPWWTAALMDQAIARAVRMGQTEVVKVFHLQLAAEHDTAINIDRMVNAKALEKRKMLENLFMMARK